MRLIHCADLHLDSKMESNLDRDAAGLRREELLDTFEEMVQYAVDHEVSVILIAGDLFDKPAIRKKAKNRVLELIKGHPGIDFCYLRGNHDRCDFFEEIEADKAVTNLKTFGADRWTSYDYGDVVVTGMELARENAATIGMNLVLDQNRLNIVMLHGQESDYPGADRAEVIHLPALRNKYIDYLALGHVHRYKKERLDERGVYCYSGCLEGRGFDECGEKGFVLLETGEKGITSSFVPIAKRCLHEVVVDVTPDMDMAEIIRHTGEAVDEIAPDDLVKITLTGKTDMNLDMDLPRLRRSLKRDFFYIKIYDKTMVAIDYESYRNDKSLKGEFVRLMEQQQMDEEERSSIIELGMRAIMGEDLEA